MSEAKFIEKKGLQKEKHHMIKLNVLSLSTITIFIFLIFCLSLYNKFNPKSIQIFSETPEKINICPYVSPNRVEGILDNLFYPYHSDIIKSIDEYEFLRDTLGKVELRMILNSNIHGDYAKDFHEKTNYHHLLILIETMEGNRFGGYTSDNFMPLSIGLTSTSVDVQKYDEAAFLFNLDTKKIYEIDKDKVDIALNCDEYYTLSFGEKDLIIWDYFLTKGGISNFPDYYGVGSKQFELTGGEEMFQVNSIEVYQVLFYPEFGDEMNRMGQYKSWVKKNRS